MIFHILLFFSKAFYQERVNFSHQTFPNGALVSHINSENVFKIDTYSIVALKLEFDLLKMKVYVKTCVKGTTSF